MYESFSYPQYFIIIYFNLFFVYCAKIQTMARIRKQGSTLSYGGLGLSKTEDRQLVRKLQKQGKPLKQLLRELVRNWLTVN